MKYFSVMCTFFILGLSGCSTLNKGQCQSGDWYGIGLADGTRGAALTQLSQHRDACVEHGITINGDEYRQGRAEGLKKYCRPLNGYQLGRQGYRYNNVCPDNLNAAFYQAHEYGYKIFSLEQTTVEMQKQLKLEEAATLDETLSKAERKEHLEVLTAIQHDLDEAYKQLDRLVAANRWER